MLASAQWADAAHTVIRATDDQGTVSFVPPDPANRDYQAITEGDADHDVAPLEIVEP